MYSSSKLLKRSAHSVPSRWWLRLYQIEKRCFTMVLALPKPGSGMLCSMKPMFQAGFQRPLPVTPEMQILISDRSRRQGGAV